MNGEFLTVVVLLITVLMRFAIILAVVYVMLPRGSLCRRCQVEMVLIRNRFLETVLPVVQRRWCLTCGWNGVARRVRPPAPRPTPHGSRSQTP
jgi:hypothetical protein